MTQQQFSKSTIDRLKEQARFVEASREVAERYAAARESRTRHEVHLQAAARQRSTVASIQRLTAAIRRFSRN